jgi:sialate O-acetylesterase
LEQVENHNLQNHIHKGTSTMSRSSSHRFMFGVIAPVLLCAGLAGSSARADEATTKPFLNPLFSDHMVLQRDVVTRIWGWTQPGRLVKVTLADKTANGVADAGGKWMVKLDPLPGGGPHTMTVAGPQTVEIKDVLVGDVWICSGQSNMQMRVRDCKDAKEEIAAANHPRIRQYSVPWCGFNPGDPQVVKAEPQDIAISKWDVCSPKTAGGFSGVGYYFARDLQKEVDVPIGLIACGVGGSSIVSWCSAPVIAAMPEIKGELQSLETLKALIKEKKVGDAYFESVIKQWWAKNDPGLKEGWFNLDCDAAAWKKVTLPGGKKAEATGLNGIVWCRKEVDLPQDWAGKNVTLWNTGIWEADKTWFNGTEVGVFDMGWINRITDIPAKVVKAGRNVIAIRVRAQPGNAFQGPSDAAYVELVGSKPPARISLGGERLLQASAPWSKLPQFPHRLDNDFQVPTVLFNGEIAPLAPLAIKGILWYQGETLCPGGSAVHRKLLPAMIADWRARFASPDCWFLIVQLPVLGGTPTQDPAVVGAADVRSVQCDVGHSVANADTAVITDLGDPNNIHPPNKQDVGKRLALIAQARIYGKSVEYSGPTFRSAAIEGDAVRIKYDHVGGGLVVKGHKLEGFAIAGADKKWVWADAKIDGDDVLLTSPQVKEPKLLRYDFVDVPHYTLYNNAGLPAAPFEAKIGG